MLIGGLLLGGLYALIAFGLSLIYGVARVLNFAHGTLLAIAGIMASVMFAAWSLSPALIAVILFPVFFAFGWLMYVTLLEPLKHRNPMQMTVGTVLVTVGLLLILSDLAALFFGPTSKNIRLELDIYQFNGIIMSTTDLTILFGIVVLTAALHLILNGHGSAGGPGGHPGFGRRPAVRCASGRHPRRHGRLRLRHRGGGGVLYTLNYPINPYEGFGLTVKAFTVIIWAASAACLARCSPAFSSASPRRSAASLDIRLGPGLSIMLLLAILVVFPHGMLSRRAS